MIVYMVTARDPYLEQNGSTYHEVTFGPWVNKSDAESAKQKLLGMTQPGYSRGTRMPAYEDIVIYETKLRDFYEDSQVY